MMMESDRIPLGAESEDLSELPCRAANRRLTSWKALAASAAAGLGLLGTGAAVASSWRGGGGGGVAQLRHAAPKQDFIAFDEEKGHPATQEKPKFVGRPTSLNSVPVTNETLKKLRTGKRGLFSSAIKINEDGKINTYYLPGAHIIDDGNSVEFRPPYRFYLMKTDTTEYSNPDNFYKPILPGKTFTVDMDFKGENGPSCGCNINFYLVDMPVALPGVDKDYYCDAQCFADKGCCHEFDMNEGNEHVQQITNHACTGGYSQDPSWKCDKYGDPINKVSPPHFGKGASNDVNGEKKFTFSQRFDVDGDDLNVITTITQGDKVIKRTLNSNGQMQDMLKMMQKGLVFVTGYWTAPHMNWMDGESCGSGTEHCSDEPAYISNWRITTNTDTPSPSPSPSPSPQGRMTCGWCESGSCNRCHEEPGWCSKNEDNCKTCGAKAKWCPKSAMTSAVVEGEEEKDK